MLKDVSTYAMLIVVTVLLFMFNAVKFGTITIVSLLMLYLLLLKTVHIGADPLLALFYSFCFVGSSATS